MITRRPANERGHADHGWLKSFHSFSFAGYYDPAHMGWGKLRVINDDRIAPDTGFGRHAHRDMEIVSYVLAGELAHRDSLGNVTAIPAGDVQRMSAGSGVEHSEFNNAPGQTTHFLQIWIVPRVTGIAPAYEQKTITSADKRGRLCPVATPDGRDGSLTINADATIYAGEFKSDEHAQLVLDPARKAYVHLIRGGLEVNGHALSSGDALLLQDEAAITLANASDAEVLVFDLAA